MLPHFLLYFFTNKEYNHMLDTLLNHFLLNVMNNTLKCLEVPLNILS